MKNPKDKYTTNNQINTNIVEDTLKKELQNKLYNILCMHSYFILADLEEVLENPMTQSTMSASKIEKIKSSIYNIMQTNLELYVILLKEF